MNQPAKAENPKYPRQNEVNERGERTALYQLAETGNEKAADCRQDIATAARMRVLTHISN